MARRIACTISMGHYPLWVIISETWYKPDAGQTDDGDSGSVEILVVLGEAAATIDPGDGALDDESVRGWPRRPWPGRSV
jgi:hypothetical protein